MKMTPTKIAEIQKKKEAREKKRPGRLLEPSQKDRIYKAGGGVAEAAAKLRRQGLKGGGLCVKGMNREAVGKNS